MHAEENIISDPTENLLGRENLHSPLRSLHIIFLVEK